MPVPILGAIAIGGAALVAGALGATLFEENKLNKERANHQEERNRLQQQIEELLRKIAEKDAIIVKLSQKIKELDEEKLQETQKRHQLLEMIDVLEQRQKALESILSGLLAFITFRLGKWKTEKIELRKSLEKAHADHNVIDALIAKIESERASLEIKMSNETKERDQMSADRKRLCEEIETIDAEAV